MVIVGTPLTSESTPPLIAITPALSISEAMAPPCTSPPACCSSGWKGSLMRQKSGATSSTRMPRRSKKGSGPVENCAKRESSYQRNNEGHTLVCSYKKAATLGCPPFLAEGRVYRDHCERSKANSTAN